MIRIAGARSGVLVAAIIGSALLSSASAQDEMTPRVSATVSPDTVAVGEPLDLEITVLVPTWFPQPPVYPSFELSNAIVRRPPDSSYPTSQRVGRNTWSGIVRRYRIYPLLGADYLLDDRQMKVTVANPGSDPIIAMADIPAVRFSASVPAGAEDLSPYLSGTRLELSLEAIGESAEFSAGDAIVLEYSAELDGLPAMFLPELAPQIEIDGVSVYRDEAVVSDGEPARRVERVTLVFEAGGEFEVPGFALEYWDTSIQAVRRAVADGFSVVVEGPPLEVAATPDEQRDWRRIITIGFGILLAALVTWRALQRLTARRRSARRRWLESEDYAFRQLEQHLKAQDPQAAYASLLAWLERLDPPQDAHSIGQQLGSPEMAASLSALSAYLYRGAAQSPNLNRLASELHAARGRLLRKRDQETDSSLPPLNPEAG